MPKRLLTKGERRSLVINRLAKEKLFYKDHEITVQVKPETDDKGRPQFIVTRMREQDFHQ